MSGLRRLSALIALSVPGVLLLAADAAHADQAYHSELLPLSASGLAGHPEPAAGHVVNIHPNGPTNYAHERYMLNGAAPETTYQVVIEVHADASCGALGGELPTAPLTTDARGNGHAMVTLAPEDVAAIRGMTLHLRWSLRVGSAAGAGGVRHRVHDGGPGLAWRRPDVSEDPGA